MGCPNRQTAFAAIINHLLSSAKSLQKGRIPPWGVYGQFGIEHIGSELKPYLIVAATGAAMTQDANATLLQLRKQRLDGNMPCNTGRIPVTAFIFKLDTELP